jgi:hypothetical protein
MKWMTTLLGGASRQTYATTLPPDRFYCLLDELPLHLIPQRALRALRSQEDLLRPLYLNPHCVLCPAGDVPPELDDREELLSGFAMEGTIAWVRDSARESPLPFWLGPQLEAVVRDLHPNKPVPSTVGGITKGLLAVAGIVVPEGSIGEGRSEREAMINKAAPVFRQKGYAPLASLIHPYHVAALRRYYRFMIRMGAIRLGDRQSPRRYVSYNDSVARFFHHHMTATLSAVAGEPLKPSYVYLASYLSGAELKKHTDREQCEFSVTLCLDFSPEPALETPWPIRLETPTSTVAVYQSIGDGLVYRGTRLPHYRTRLGEGQTSTSIFFHYVAADFAGSLD